MWLTGFDVECLSTLYIDKPMKAQNLMQAIARANRVFPGKECGVIVDYNGMLKSLREALAQYALGDEQGSGDGGEFVAPIEEPLAALVQAIEAAEKHLLGLGLMRIGCVAPQDLVAFKPCGTLWTNFTPRTKRSGGLRLWPGRCSSVSRLC
jgi:hypothetical protein